MADAVEEVSPLLVDFVPPVASDWPVELLAMLSVAPVQPERTQGPEPAELPDLRCHEPALPPDAPNPNNEPVDESGHYRPPLRKARTFQNLLPYPPNPPDAPQLGSVASAVLWYDAWVADALKGHRLSLREGVLQETAAWFRMRRGKLTASTVWKPLARAVMPRIDANGLQRLLKGPAEVVSFVQNPTRVAKARRVSSGSPATMYGHCYEANALRYTDHWLRDFLGLDALPVEVNNAFYWGVGAESDFLGASPDMVMLVEDPAGRLGPSTHGRYLWTEPDWCPPRWVPPDSPRRWTPLLVEAKSPFLTHNFWGCQSEGPTVDYWLQVQAQLALTGTTQALLVYRGMRRPRDLRPGVYTRQSDNAQHRELGLHETAVIFLVLAMPLFWYRQVRPHLRNWVDRVRMLAGQGNPQGEGRVPDLFDPDASETRGQLAEFRQYLEYYSAQSTFLLQAPLQVPEGDEAFGLRDGKTTNYKPIRVRDFNRALHDRAWAGATTDEVKAALRSILQGGAAAAAGDLLCWDPLLFNLPSAAPGDC